MRKPDENDDLEYFHVYEIYWKAKFLYQRLPQIGKQLGLTCRLPQAASYRRALNVDRSNSTQVFKFTTSFPLACVMYEFCQSTFLVDIRDKYGEQPV